MTPDPRIFDSLLPLVPTGVVVDWIQPERYESIRAYAKRLAATIPPQESTIVCGVSFGGIVARELANCLNAKACVLVSSVRSPQELPPWYRIFRCLAPSFAEGAMNAVGTLAAYWPRRLRTQSTRRWMKLAGASGQWHRWATAAVLNWNTSAAIDRIPVIQIHGDCDTTFPIRFTNPDRVIHGGGHVLPLTHCKALADILQQVAT